MSSNPNLHISEAGYLWIFAVVVLIHLMEELWGGTRRSFNPHKLGGLDLSPKGFVRTILVGLVGLALVILLALELGFPQFLLVSLGTSALANAARHAVASIKDVTYSPGLVTGLLVFVPLGALTLIRLEPAMSGLRFGVAIGIGLAFQVGASFVGHRGRQLIRAYQARE